MQHNWEVRAVEHHYLENISTHNEHVELLLSPTCADVDSWPSGRESNCQRAPQESTKWGPSKLDTPGGAREIAKLVGHLLCTQLTQVWYLAPHIVPWSCQEWFWVQKQEYPPCTVRCGPLPKQITLDSKGYPIWTYVGFCYSPQSFGGGGEGLPSGAEEDQGASSNDFQPTFQVVQCKGLGVQCCLSLSVHRFMDWPAGVWGPFWLYLTKLRSPQAILPCLGSQTILEIKPD